jgi:hypothetical protein
MADMPAESLMKALPRQKHEKFLQQLGMVDIQEMMEKGSG